MTEAKTEAKPDAFKSDGEQAKAAADTYLERSFYMETY